MSLYVFKFFLSNVAKQTNKRYQKHNLLCHGGNFKGCFISSAKYAITILHKQCLYTYCKAKHGITVLPPDYDAYMSPKSCDTARQ